MGPLQQFSFFFSAFTQFLFHLTMNVDYRNDMMYSSYRITEALVQDVWNMKNMMGKSEAYEWPIDQQILERGFMFEQHKIQTEDGYILTAFRIPGKFLEDYRHKKKQPVYMQHGLIDDGGTWFFNNATVDLSLILAEKGYDVWITNSRGTVYSN